MPIYEYICEDCGHIFSALRRISQSDDDLECPNCGSNKIKRKFSTFATSGFSSKSSASSCSAPAGSAFS